MPQIIVKADTADGGNEGAIMLRERVTISDFESGHFAAQLVERINWAVGDADEVERDRAREPKREVELEAGDVEGETPPETVDERAAGRGLVAVSPAQ